MKKRSSSLFEQMSTKHLEELTNTVNETLDTCNNICRNKKFTSAELWNIQRHGKLRIQRRFYF